MKNPVDAVVGYFSPVSGLKRQLARQALARAYEGANTNDGWRPRRAGASADSDHLADAKRLRERARSLEQNVPYITRALGCLTSATIGTGITPESTDARAAEVMQLWERFVKECDADGLLDFYALQSVAYRAMARDGEVLIRRRPRRTEDGLAVPLQLQMLEADYIDTARSGPVTGGGQIVNGIEYDAIGKVRAYWLYTQHPGSARYSLGLSSRPIPASEIIHLFAPNRPGQGRGFSRLAPVIARARDLMLYQDAELQRKNLETRLCLIASGDVASLANPTADYHAGVDGSAADLGALPSGGITQVPDGLKLTQIEPKAMPGAVEYMKMELHLISAGIGVPYESMTGDMSEVNFSSARIRQIEFRRDVEQEQWLVVIPCLCDQVWEWFIDAARLQNGRRYSYGVDWSTPRWDYVNPEQDVKAELAAMGGGLLAPSESLRKRGYKPEKVFAQMGKDFELMKASGALGLMQFLSGTPAGDSSN